MVDYSKWNNIDVSDDEGDQAACSSTSAAPGTNVKQPLWTILSPEESNKEFLAFVDVNKPLIRKFGVLQSYTDSKNFLLDNMQLINKNAFKYLLGWCIDLEVNRMHDFTLHVAHQLVCLRNVIELVQHIGMEPVSSIMMFFDQVHREEIDCEIQLLGIGVADKAKEERFQVLKTLRNGEKKQLGPGGLDPEEVMVSLPLPLKICFEIRDADLLRRTTESMDVNEAVDHMNRCVAAGLWVLDLDKFAFPFPMYDENGIMFGGFPVCKPDYLPTLPI